MGVMYRSCKRFHQLSRFARRQASLTQLRGETSSVHIFQSTEWAVVMLADLVDLNDVRMLQRGDRFRLRAKTIDFVRLRRRSGPHDFEGDGTLQSDVTGLVNHAHSTPAQFAFDFIAG